MPNTITAITNPAYKTGTSKSGQPWTLMQVVVDDKYDATCFAPAKIGDEVKLTHNAQYNNYSAEVMTAAKKERSEIVDKLDRILAILEAPTLIDHDPKTTLQASSYFDKPDQPPTTVYDEGSPF